MNDLVYLVLILACVGSAAALMALCAGLLPKEGGKP